MEPHESKELTSKIEAILFSAGRSVPLDEIAKICGVSPHLVKEGVKALHEEMERRGSPLLLIEEVNAWKLTVREKYLDLVRDIIPHTELDKATLETLAVIAWKQPVMQAEVVKIRTSAAYEHIARLVELGFIAKDKKGRSFVLKTTGRFFDYFDLPGKEALKEMLKGIEGSLQTTAKDEGLTGDKLGPFEVYTAKEGEQTAAQPAETTEAERLGKLEVYEEPQEETEEGEVPEEAAELDIIRREATPEEPEEDEEEKAKRVIQELAEEREPEKTEEKKPEKRLHPALESFIEEEKKPKKEEEEE